MTVPPTGENDFARAAENQGAANVFGDFWAFLRESKKWWLAPILVILVVLSLLVLLSGSAAAPFIYTLF